MNDEPIDPQRHLRRMWDNAPKLAQAKANRVYLEEYRKTLKATLMHEHADLPLSAQERDAYADPRYIAHLEALRVAVEEEEKLRWRMVTDSATVEVWRSTEASNRAIDRGAR